MLANLARNKFRYLLGAILIIVLALVISAYRSGEIDRMFNEGRQASSAVIYGPPGR